MENNDVVQFDLKNLIGILMSNAVVIILVTLIFAAVSLVYTKVCIPKKYTSSVSLYVMNNKVTQNTGEILSSDISASQMLVNTYAVILSDNLVMEDISKILLKKYGKESISSIFPVIESENGDYIPPSSLASCISMGSVNETEVLQIMATTTDPQISVDICLAMSEVAPKILSNVMGVAYVNPIGYPELPEGSSSPSVLKNVLFGTCLGFILSVIFAVVMKFANNTVDDSETLKNKFGVPVLGEIPVYTVPECEGRNNVWFFENI